MKPQYKLEEADVILSLDADFLGGIAHPGFLPHSQQIEVVCIQIAA